MLEGQTVGTGMKYDKGKPRMDLLDPDFLEHVAQVLTFGANKYAAHNWREGINISRLIGAAYRHLGAINRGEDIDPESGCSHAAHLGCCVMFLDWTLNNKPELDDRWRKNG
jgi:dATP/dGTP diphosphohydrolase